MKKIIPVIFILLFHNQLQAGTTYNVTTNTSWNGNFPNNCGSCTFNISAGVTLTLNTNATCHTCVINGGTIEMTQDFTFQSTGFNNLTINLGGNTLNLQNNGTSFSNTIVNATAASKLIPTGSLSISGSTFNFNGTSEFRNNGGTLNINASNLYFYGNSYFKVTAGPVNLNSSSQIITGDGSISSSAYLLFNGPQLNLVDAGSALYVANVNNYYYNWGSYKSLSNSKTYTTTNNNKNCGGTNQNACAQQYFYGCASFGSLGPVTCTALASTISDFKAIRSEDNIKLIWKLSDNVQSSFLKIERSSDGLGFNPISSMEVIGQTNDYNFTDHSPAAGENKYRISLTNADGKISYSNIISVQHNASTELSVFPNPSTGGRFFVQISSVENVTVSVYCMDGQLLYLGSFAGQLKYAINLSHLKNRQPLIVHLMTREKSATFNLLNLP